MKWMKVAMTCVAGAFVLTSCDDDDDKKFDVPEAVQTAFNQQYGNVGRVEWDRERGNYIVAEFWKDNKEHDAWYSYEGQWMMTEVDYGQNIQALPQAVQDGFYASAYAQWVIDDIDEIQRPDYAATYKIEVEQKGQRDMDLYFDVNGVLFKEVADGNDEHNEGMLPTQIPTQVQAFIDGKYAGAKVVDIDAEHGRYEVDLIHNGQSIDVIFDSSYNWLSSATDYSRNVPQVVKDVIAAKYAGKRIDDCDFVETAQNEKYYVVDLDNTNFDVKISEDGQTVNEIPD